MNGATIVASENNYHTELHWPPNNLKANEVYLHNRVLFVNANGEHSIRITSLNGKTIFTGRGLESLHYNLDKIYMPGTYGIQVKTKLGAFVQKIVL